MAWHHVAGLEYLERAQGRLQVKVQASCSGDPSILEIPVPWDYTKDGHSCGEEPPEPMLVFKWQSQKGRVAKEPED